MVRVIFFVLLAYLIYSLLKAYSFKRKPDSRYPQEPAPSDEEEMVFDPQCQSYVAKKDAISQAGKFFCSEACAKQYLSR